MKRKYCYMISGLTILITIILTIHQLKNEHWETQLSWWGLTVFIFPILLYRYYYFSQMNKLISFSIAFLNDWVCWIIPNYIHHYTTEFQFVNDGESLLISKLMFAIKLTISIIFIIYYVIKLTSNKKSRVSK